MEGGARDSGDHGACGRGPVHCLPKTLCRLILKKKHPRRAKLATELNYFRNNRHRMQYAMALANHLPIGSGVTEAACKTLVTQRLKCSGMRWKTAGGQGVLTIRGLIQSNRFDAGWQLLSSTYRQAVSMPDNIVPLNARNR